MRLMAPVLAGAVAAFDDDQDFPAVGDDVALQPDHGDLQRAQRVGVACGFVFGHGGS